MSARLALLLIASTTLSACASAGAQEPTAKPVAAPTPTPARSLLPPGAIAFHIVPDRSLATIRVREQVANVPLPGEAVLTSSAFSGSLVLLPDGSFAQGSTISIQLDTLKSDSDLRDEWIKFNTLDTRRFPRAEFTATRIAGIPLPLPGTGEWQADLRGTMRIHGVEREMTWPLTVARSADEVRARGRTTFRFGDYGMAVPANRMILSVVDDVRLEVDIVVRQE